MIPCEICKQPINYESEQFSLIQIDGTKYRMVHMHCVEEAIKLKETWSGESQGQENIAGQ